MERFTIPDSTSAVNSGQLRPWTFGEGHSRCASGLNSVGQPLPGDVAYPMSTPNEFLDQRQSRVDVARGGFSYKRHMLSHVFLPTFHPGWTHPSR